ncbi:MAG: hypothetical protein WBQ45_26935 [Roseiarcus sp.]|jgi:hypothetical protein|uniref:hypothetical protein n=1 Tax=Roseiarcus sp. TaxID=1969460 RepID=UPI003BB1B4F4
MTQLIRPKLPRAKLPRGSSMGGSTSEAIPALSTIFVGLGGSASPPLLANTTLIFLSNSFVIGSDVVGEATLQNLVAIQFTSLGVTLQNYGSINIFGSKISIDEINSSAELAFAGPYFNPDQNSLKLNIKIISPTSTLGATLTGSFGPNNAGGNLDLGAPVAITGTWIPIILTTPY